MSANVSSARTTIATAAPATAREAVASDAGPWPLIRRRARAIATAIATCLVFLAVIELGAFRSGFVAAHATVTDPQWPSAKFVIAARQPNASVLYVGDSTIMTSVLPPIVSRECGCGPGFNAGFSSANPWLTKAFAHRLLAFMHPKLVVISVPPWTVDTAKRFHAEELARQVMTGEQLAASGLSLDLADRFDQALGEVWSAYGQREVLKEWFSSLTPAQRYDERLLGYYVAPGAANSEARLVAAAQRLFADVGAPSVSAPGAVEIASFVADLRSRGIAVAFLLPPLHPAAEAAGGPFLSSAEAAIRELAAQRSVPIIDCRSVASAQDFRDATHLLRAAAERHSACVGEQLRALGD